MDNPSNESLRSKKITIIRRRTHVGRIETCYLYAKRETLNDRFLPGRYLTKRICDPPSSSHFDVTPTPLSLTWCCYDPFPIKVTANHPMIDGIRRWSRCHRASRTSPPSLPRECNNSKRQIMGNQSATDDNTSPMSLSFSRFPLASFRFAPFTLPDFRLRLSPLPAFTWVWFPSVCIRKFDKINNGYYTSYGC